MKKLFRALARIVPRCSSLSQAVAFNMFLAFFSSLLVVLGLVGASLREEGGRKITTQLSKILAPGVWQLLSDSLAHHEITPWAWEVFGWLGTVIVGTQVMNLIVEGIHLIYGDRDEHSFFWRQSRSLLLFCAAIGTWLVAIALNVVYIQPLREYTAQEFHLSFLIRGFWVVMLPLLGGILRMLVLAFIYRAGRTAATTWRSVLPGAAASSILLWGVDLLFAIYIRSTPYAPVYGELATAIGLMMRMEVSALLIFLGAAWNAESAV